MSNHKVAINGKQGWQPTLNQIRAAQALVDPAIGSDFKDVAKAANISRVTLSLYLKDQQFCALVHELLPQHTDNLLFLAWKVIYEKIVEEKDLEACKLLFRLKKQIADVTNINVTSTTLKFEQYLMDSKPDAPRKRVTDESVLEPEDAEFSEAEA